MESVLNVDVSYFKNQKTPGNPATVNLLSCLQSPRHYKKQLEVAAIADKKERGKAKQLLPAFTPSGTFTYRADENLVKHTGLIAVDIDGVGSVEATKELVSKNPHTAYCGKSVSGRGLWALLSIAEPDRHKEHFGFLEYWFAKWGMTIDPACKDVSRLRGYAHDPEAYYNHGAEPLTLPAARTTPAKSPLTHARPAGYIGGFEGEAFDWCVRVKDESLFAPGNRNGWLTRLVNLLNERGVSRQFAESECVGRYAQDGFDGKEILATIRSIYRSKQATHGSNPYTGAKTMLPDAKPYIGALASGSIKTPPSLHNHETLPFTQPEIDALPAYPADWDSLEPLAEYPASQYEDRRLSFVEKHAQTIADFAEAFGLDMATATIRDSVRENETLPIPAYLPAQRQHGIRDSDLITV